MEAAEFFQSALGICNKLCLKKALVLTLEDYLALLEKNDVVHLVYPFPNSNAPQKPQNANKV